MSESRHLLQDLQASAPEVQLGLSRAGVQGVEKAIRLRWGGAEKLISAEIDCTVDLDPQQKGVHMSRFPELFEEAIDEVVLEEAFLVEELAEHIARHIVARQAAGRAEVRIAARYPLERRTPVTGLATQEMISIVASSVSRRPGSTPARAHRDWCAANPPSGYSRRASKSPRSNGSCSSSPSRPTTSAAAERSTSARTNP